MMTRQPNISDMENGKIEVGTCVLPLLANALEKPMSYFFPKPVLLRLSSEKDRPLEEELLIHFRQIWDEHLQKVGIKIIKVLSDFDPEDTILDSLENLAIREEMDQETFEILERRKKRKTK